MERVNAKVRSEQVIGSEPNILLRSLPMSDKEARCKYLKPVKKKAYPGPEYLQCIFCHHNFVDFPPGNESVKAREEEIWSKYREQKKQWDLHVNSKGYQLEIPPPKTKKGKGN